MRRSNRTNLQERLKITCGYGKSGENGLILSNARKLEDRTHPPLYNSRGNLNNIYLVIGIIHIAATVNNEIFKYNNITMHKH